MTPREFLAAAIAAPRHRGAAVAAEAGLQQARAAVNVVKGQAHNLAQQRVAVSQVLDGLSRDLRAARTAAGKTFVASLGKPDAPALVNVSQQLRTLRDRIQVGHDANDFLAGEELQIAVRQIEAEIALEQKTRAWIEAAGHADLQELHAVMLPVLKADPAVSIEIGAGSKAAAYADALTHSDLLLVSLRESLQRAIVVAEEYFSRKESSNGFERA